MIKNKNKISLLLIMVLCLSITTTAFADTNAESKDIENKIANKVIYISKEEAQKLKKEAGFDDYEKTIGGFYIISEQKNISKENSKLKDELVVTIKEFGEEEYYTKNKTSSYEIDWNDPYLPGASGSNGTTVTAQASFSYTTSLSSSVSLSAAFIEAELGVTIGETESVTASGTYTAPIGETINILGYPKYRITEAELWEDDVLFDDFICDISTKELYYIYFDVTLE